MLLWFDLLNAPAGVVPMGSEVTMSATPRFEVRALQAPTPAINGDNLRPRYDAQGKVKTIDPCYGDYQTDFNDNCLAPISERACSSPVFIDQPATGQK